jgi:hypothetical protein
MKYPVSTPIIKKDSKKLMKLKCSFLLAVTNPIVANTETFINAKLIPTVANNSLVIRKEGTEGIITHITVTSPSAIQHCFLITDPNNIGGDQK